MLPSHLSSQCGLLRGQQRWLVGTAAPALQPRRCLPRQQPQQQQQQQLTSSSRRRLQQQPLRPAAAASPSPNSGAGGDWSWHSVDENPASSSQAEDGPLAAGTGSAAGSGAPKESAFLALPLLIASSLSHVNRQYIRMRRRRNWWRKLGGYPRVPGENMDQLPEPAVQLWQKVLPLGAIFFCASFNLTILQSLKDAIMVTAGGAEALPFLASFCVLPASVGFFMLYGKLVAHLPERAVFYASVLPLLAYYALFACVLYPIAGSLHPLDLMRSLMPAVPVGLHGLLKVAGHWTYSLFFCMAELWGAVVISVLFWSLANEVCTVDEAKAVYPFMAIGANLALVAAGCFIRLASHATSALAAGAASAGADAAAGDGQLLLLRLLIGTVLAMTAAMFAAKHYIDRRILAPAAAAAAAAAAGGGGQGGGEQAAAKQQPKKKNKKAKGSFSDGLAVLRKSPKIRNLALLVMSYGVGHRLFEFAWKGQLRLLYPTVQGYQAVLADVATYTGMLTLASMVVSRLVFQHAGWGVAASVTPAVMGLAGVAFFGCSLAAQLPGLTPELAAAVAGAGATAGVVTQVFARSSKYALFDPAKEMVYIEMDADEKKQGKAAVDLVGSQIGKSGASWITQACLLGCGSIAAAMPFTGIVFAGVIITWIRATMGLHQQMQATEQGRLAAQAAAMAAAEAPGGSSSGSGGAGLTESARDSEAPLLSAASASSFDGPHHGNGSTASSNGSSASSSSGSVNGGSGVYGKLNGSSSSGGSSNGGGRDGSAPNKELSTLSTN